MSYKDPQQQRLARQRYYHRTNENQRTKESNKLKQQADPEFYNKRQYIGRINRLKRNFDGLVSEFKQGNYKAVIGFVLGKHSADYGSLEDKVTRIESLIRSLKLISKDRYLRDVIGDDYNVNLLYRFEGDRLKL